MRLKADLTLLFVAAIWGSGFVAQRLAAASLTTYHFNAGRFLLAGLLLFVFTHLQKRFAPAEPTIPTHGTSHRQVIGMVLAGLLLFAGANLQQMGLETTTISNASFITGMYVVLVPLILFFWGQKQISKLSWLAVGLAVLGIMLLSLRDELRLAPGDALELAGAFLWALHIIQVGRLSSQGVNVLNFSIIQFAICGTLNLFLAFGLHPGQMHSLSASWAVVLYSAIFPIGLGFSLQIAGQRHAPPVDAAIILSMEAVFATLFGYLFLRELLLPQQWAGCALLLLAALISQIKPASAQLESA